MNEWIVALIDLNILFLIVASGFFVLVVIPYSLSGGYEEEIRRKEKRWSKRHF
tara:strand:+ start:572 stop:730 length:159 start_codon:yes stop_codon:yes gene_type:complete